MDRAKTMRFGLIIYTSITVFLFIYVFPFVFIGYHGQTDGVKPAQLTVLDVQTGTEYPMLTRAAVWFAKYPVTRLWLSVLLVLLMLGIEFIMKEKIWKRDVYCIVMWVSLAVFMLNLLGLIALLT